MLLTAEMGAANCACLSPGGELLLIIRIHTMQSGPNPCSEDVSRTQNGIGWRLISDFEMNQACRDPQVTANPQRRAFRMAA
jgi:hypothetical protein